MNNTKQKSSRIIHNVKLYFSFLKVSLKELMIYRVDCIIGIFSQSIVQLVTLIFIFIIFQNIDNIGGWSFEQILLLYGITRISVGLSGYCFDALYDIGPKLIRNGDFDKILLRPVHPLISIIGSSKEVTSVGDFLLGIIISVVMLNRLMIPITFILIVKILFFSIVGTLIIGAIQTICSVTSFWTHKSNEIIWSFYRIYTFTDYPISIYNNIIKVILTFILPFAFVAYFPLLNIFEINTYMAYLSPIVAIILWIVTVKVWNICLNKYRSTGT